MKLIHTADLHLGSKMESKFPPEKARQRRTELRDSFARMVERAKELDAKIVLIAGDAFDTDPATPADRAFFFDTVAANPDLTFLLLRGNHDATVTPTSECPNLVTFGDAWTVYQKDEVGIAGIEITKENCASLYDDYSPVPDKVNIAVLHGKIGSSPAPNTVVLSRLADRGIDYLALGDYHARQEGKLDAHGAWAYPGSPEGRGFDEPGEKGFLLLTVEDGSITTEFIPHACRTLHEIDCDISSSDGVVGATEIARDAIAGIPERDPIRLNLVGAVNFDRTDLAEDIEMRLGGKRFFVSVKDKTSAALDFDAIRDELSLRGEFLRLLEDKGLPAEDSDAILSLGLRALSGQKID